MPSRIARHPPIASAKQGAMAIGGMAEIIGCNANRSIQRRNRMAMARMAPTGFMKKMPRAGMDFNQCLVRKTFEGQVRGAPVSGNKVEAACPKSGTDLTDGRQARPLSSIAAAKCPSISNED